MVYDVIIIGGGASGLFCAANIKLDKKNGLILESSKHTGIKLMASGSGQCNFTHGGDIRNFTDRYGQNGGKIRGILYRFNNKMTCRYFEDAGVATFEREDGKIFPKSMDSREIRDLLLEQAKENGFDIHTDTKAVYINVSDSSAKEEYQSTPQEIVYEVQTTAGTFRGKNLVIATGGRSYPNTGSDGMMLKILEKAFPDLKINPCTAALVPVYVENYSFAKLSGIAHRVRVTLPYAKGKNIVRIGDMLFTHKNLSGPVILDMSRYMKAGSVFYVDYLTEMFNGKSYTGEGFLKVDGEKRSTGNLIAERFDLPKALATALADRALADADMKKQISKDGRSEEYNRKKAGSLSKYEIRAVEKILRNSRFVVSGKGGFGEAMATAGGVDISEVSTSTMEAKKYPGLHLIGEVLDIDGDTGGYNLQFAFSSAQTAARHILQLP